jgi:MFS family permease
MVSITLPLAVAQTVIWASIFYLFPAFLPIWERETLWSKSELTGAFTLALFAAAAASPAAGRLIDAGYGRTLMLCGTSVSILGLLMLSQVAELWQFYAVWLILGLCMAASLYEPCFANLIRHLQQEARPAITRITLVAGLAGTVAFPSSHWLTSILTWREAVICYAAALALITLPLTARSITRLQVQFPITSSPSTSDARNVPYGAVFWLLAISFMLIALVHGMIITHLLPLLAERGITAGFAIIVASLIGPMQVVGRMLMMATESRSTTVYTAMACYAGMALGIAALMFGGVQHSMIILFVILHGAAYGVTSIIRPILTREMLGAANFGQISGRMSGLFMFGTAVAPFGGSLIWQVAGYTTMLAVAGALMLIGIVLLRQATRQGDHPPTPAG